MKQINLLPRSLESTTKPINPFWSRITVLALVLFVGSTATSIYMRDAVAFFYTFNETASTWDSLIEQQEDLTVAYAQREEELKQAIDEFRAEIQQQQQVAPEHMVPIADLLMRVITPMPQTLWLTTISCDYREHSLVLVGRSIREGDLERYIEQGFSKDQGFSRPTRQYLRLNEDTLHYEFSFEVRFHQMKPDSIVEAR